VTHTNTLVVNSTRLTAADMGNAAKAFLAFLELYKKQHRGEEGGIIARRDAAGRN
jgi:hypothetical protein